MKEAQTIISRANRHTDSQYNCIDLLKFIMAFAVVAIHTNPLKCCKNTYIFTLYENITDLSVPFFFVASGYLLSKKMKYPFGSASVEAVNKQLHKIFKMYIIWMLIYTPIDVVHKCYQRVPLLKAVLLYIRGMVFIGEQYNSWPLWFLLSSTYALILIKILMKRKISFEGLLALSALFAFIKYGLDCFSTFNQQASSILGLISRAIGLSVCSGRILSGVIYIPIGMYLGYNSLRICTSILLFVSGFTLRCLIHNASLDGLLLIITITGFWGIIVRIRLPDCGIYNLLRKSSMVIYLLHMYVWTIYYCIVYKEKTYGFDSFVVTSIISLLLAWAYLSLKEKVVSRVICP